MSLPASAGAFGGWRTHPGMRDCHRDKARSSWLTSWSVQSIARDPPHPERLFMQLFQRERLFFVQEAHQFAEKLHSVFLQHDRMRSFAQLDQPLVGGVLQLREIPVCQVAR